MPSPSFTQVAFRIRNDDGSETTATWRQAINTPDTKIVNENFRVRFRIDEGNSYAWSNLTFNLYYQKNGAGGYAAVTGSTPVQFALSGNFADHANCTTQLSGGSGTFVTSNAGMAEAQGITNSGTKNYLFETEFCLKFDGAQMAETDYVDLRIYNGSSAIAGYTYTPRITGTNIRALTGEDIATPAPAVEKPTITQNQVLTGKDIATPAPTVEKPSLGIAVQQDDLVGKDIATPAVTVQKPTTQQIHALISKDISTPVAAVQKSTLKQVHVLTGKDIATPIPAIAKTTISQVHILTGKAITTPSPTFAKPTISQVHVLISKDIVSGIPALGKPELGIASGETDEMAGKDIILEAFFVEKPVLAQVHVLGSMDIGTSAPIVEDPTLGIISGLSSAMLAVLFEEKD